jgi:hypothetical protein
VGSERANQRDSVTSSEVNAPELFDFGPDVERPATGPQAALPPWMADQARAAQAAAVDARPRAGQTIAARLQATPAQPAPEMAFAEGSASAGTVAVEEDRTPEPVVVPEFARVVPAPRKRRKPVPADHVVIAAPAVVDGSGLVMINPGDDLSDGPVAGLGAPGAATSAPVLPGQRVEAAPSAPAGAPAEEPARVGRRRPRWTGIAQVAAIVGLGAAAGIYAAGGVGFLENRTKAVPPTAEAGAWVLNNLAGVGTVLVPSSMTDSLLQHGQDGDALSTYPPGSAADLALAKNCCSYLVLVGTPGQEPGSGLPASVHTLFERSRPAAVFTTDGGWTQVRQVLPGSPDKVAADLQKDHAALVATGKSLIASGKVELSALAKQQVQDGEVDARVLIGVVAVALEHKISITSFPGQPGETDPAILRRSVAVSEIDGKPVKDGSAAVKAVKDLLARQTGIYRPAGAEVHPVDGVTALEFRFDAPSPFGVLTLTDEDGNRS